MKKLLQFLGEPQPITAAAAGLLSALLGLFLLQTRLGVPLENLSYDLSIWLSRDRRAANAPTNVVIVYIDNPVGTASTPPDRAVYVRLLERVKANGARLVAFDIAFIEPKPGDTNFADALRQYAPVVIGAEWSARRTKNSATVEEFRQQFEMPADLLREAATNVGLLSISATESSSGDICRTLLGFKGTLDEPKPTLGRLAAELAGGTNLPNPRAKCWLNYYGPAFTLPHRTLAETLESPVDEIFNGKVVFVGADPRFRPEKPDHYGTPYTRFGARNEQTFMPGVEIHATTFCNLVARDWLSRPPPWLETLVILGWLAGMGFVLGLYPRPLLLVAGAIVNPLLGVAIAVGQSNVWWPWIIPAIVPIFVQSCIVLLWKADPEVRSEWLLHLFRRRAMESSKTIVVLDLVGYSKKVDQIEEQLSPKSVQDLNDQIQRLIDDALNKALVQRKDAKITTTGDGAILVFDAPLEANRFAEAVHRSCEAFNRGKTEPIAQKWFRIGAATGDVFFLRGGGAQNLAGRTVGRATRLEAGGEAGQTLVDLATFEGLPSDEQQAYEATVEYIVEKHGMMIPARRRITIPKPELNRFVEPTINEPLRPPRQDETGGRHSGVVIKIEVTLDLPVSEFHPEAFKQALESNIGIDVSQIRIVSIRAGSTIFDLEGDPKELGRIIHVFRSSQRDLHNFARATGLRKFAWLEGGTRYEVTVSLDSAGGTDEPASKTAGSKESTARRAGAPGRMAASPGSHGQAETANKDPHDPHGRSDGASKQPGQPPSQPKIFISYSHHDKRFLIEFQAHLKPYARTATFTAWSDENIATGASWPKEIRDALNEAKLAVLLVSPNFLASEYIHQHEFSPLLEKVKKNQVQMLWVPIHASSFQKTPLEQIQAAYNPKRPLAQMGGAERNSAWVKVCVEIEKALSGE